MSIGQCRYIHLFHLPQLPLLVLRQFAHLPIRSSLPPQSLDLPGGNDTNNPVLRTER
jgi:hypothetical protein